MTTAKRQEIEMRQTDDNRRPDPGAVRVRGHGGVHKVIKVPPPSRRRRGSWRIAIGVMSVMAVLLLAAAKSSAATLPAGSTAILSGAPSLFEALPAPAGYGGMTRWSVSQDGRYVAFEATSDGLADGDDDRVQNVYVKDRATGAVRFVSRAPGHPLDVGPLPAD